jgi:hypothetical protein
VSWKKHEDRCIGRTMSPKMRQLSLWPVIAVRSAARTNEWLQEHVEVLDLFLRVIKLRERKTSGRRGVL